MKKVSIDRKRKSRYEVYSFEEDYYGVRLIVFIGSRDAFGRWSEANFGQDLTADMPEGADGGYRNSHNLLWLPEFSYDGLAHELLHMVFAVLGRFRFEETYTYYLEHLLAKVCRAARRGRYLSSPVAKNGL